MSNADDLLRTGDLDGARSALVEAARRNPGDISIRLFLFQLLAVIGDWEKSTKQLATLAQLSPEAQMLAVVYGQAIAAEQQRTAIFAGEALAPVHGNSPWVAAIAEAIRLDAIGDHEAAATVREAGFAAAPDTPGALAGARFDWITDADARFGPCMEAIIGGQYGLLPFADIAHLKSEGPHDLRDVAWYPVEIMLKAGTSIAALLPTRYPGAIGSPQEQLARMTTWRDDGTGSGQHLWVLSTDEEHELLSVRSLAFD